MAEFAILQQGNENIVNAGNQITVHLNYYNQTAFQNYHFTDNIDPALLRSLIPIFEERSVERFCIKINFMGQMITLNVDRQETIYIIKLKLQLRYAVPFSKQCIVFDDKVLEDRDKLSDCNVKNGNVLYMIYHQGENGPVIVLQRILGRKFCVRVEPEMTVGELKKRIEEEEGLPVNRQRLYLDDTMLCNECKISDYSFGKKLVKLASTVTSDEYINVKVKTLTGKTLDIVIGRYETVDDLKLRIQDKEGIPPDQQRIIFKGEQLVGEMQLSKYFVGENSLLHLVLRLRGGYDSRKIRIHIRTSIGQIISLGFHSLTTNVSELKHHIKSYTDFSMHQQKLFYRNMELKNDSKTLEDYGIKKQILGNPEIIDVVLC